MENKRPFQEFENESFLMRLAGGLCGDRSAHQDYKESYENLLSLVRDGVRDEVISPEEGERILRECRK